MNLSLMRAIRILAFGETSYHIDYITNTLLSVRDDVRLERLALEIGVVDTCMDWTAWNRLSSALKDIPCLQRASVVEVKLVLWEAMDVEPEWASYEFFVVHAYNLLKPVRNLSFSVADELYTLQYFRYRRE